MPIRCSTPEERAAYNARYREYARLRRERDPEREKERQREKDRKRSTRGAVNHEKRKASETARRQRLVQDEAAFKAYLARKREAQARYLTRHPDRAANSKAKYEAKIRASRSLRNPNRSAAKPRPVAYNAEVARESRLRVLLGNAAYMAADAAISRRMDSDARDDIMQSIVLACLEGSLEVGDVKSRSREFISAYWRGRPEFRLRSLDAPSFDDGSGSLHDVVSASLWEVYPCDSR